MGRINLAPLRVRSSAIRRINQSEAGTLAGETPIWMEILRDFPPAQVLTRKQPNQHPLVHVRTHIPAGSDRPQQFAAIAPSPRNKHKSRKEKRIFAPNLIKYEEDELRRQFFQDHPWELARPRVVLESDGNQYKHANWSTGLQQKGVPLTGESVIQRQLWLLQNTPNITVPEAYDIARTEFYMLRRAEETQQRIAVEEAEHMGARWEKTTQQWGMELESQMYDDWEKYARDEMMLQMQKSSAFSGEVAAPEQDALEEVDEAENAVESPGSNGTGSFNRSDPFAVEAQRRKRLNMA